VYLHPMRWTSLGLSLIEAMQLAMPVVVLAATDAVSAVPPDAGVLSTDLDVLRAGFRLFLNEPEVARAAGTHARAAAIASYGLERFLRDWDQLLDGLIGKG
jgi:glycosyltransferase involved in cell wall biosynthesis